MTVPSEVSKAGPYFGNGATVVFGYGFKIVNPSHLQVVIRDAQGDERTLVLNADYSVSGVGSETGGSVTTTVAPVAGESITILRNVPFTQETDLENQGAYYAETVEDALDLSVMRDQQLKEGVDRAVKVPENVDPSGLDDLVADIMRLADSADNIDTVANISPAVVTVAGIRDEVVTVAGIAANVTAVADIAADVSTVAGVAVDIPTVAANVADITNFADVYQGAKATDPALRNDGTALQAGDLYFNTTKNAMMVYSGVFWAEVVEPKTGLLPASYVGDGTDTDFSLPRSVVNSASVLVWVGGVRQVPDVDYTASGLTLHLNTAPGNGVAVDVLCMVAATEYVAPADGSVKRVSLSPEISSSVAVSVKEFGAVGDGVADDTDAIQAAIDFVAPFVWKGGTRATEEGSGSGSVFFPKGTYRITRKIKLAPNLRIHGEGCGNDWTVRNAATGGATKWGSSIFVDYTNYQDYAIDTCPYHADGIRYNNDTLEGGDSFNGLKTEVHNVTIEDISIIGNYTTKGVNLAGGVFSKVRNVFLKGFTVGWRYSAVWYGVHENCRSWVSWKGLIAYISVTDLALDNSSWQKGYDAPAYNVATMGGDSGLPSVGGWWTQLFNDVTVGITNFYSCLTARNICVEGFQIYSAGRSAVNDFESVYIEGITYIAIISMGPDQSNERHVFDTITTNSGDLIGQSQSRLEVGCRSTISTQAGFNKLFYDVASDPIYRPVIWGLKYNASDIFPKRVMRRADVYHTEGIWHPELKAGGASLGANAVSENRFVRIGNMVTVWGYIQIPTKTGATGSLTVGGLPLMVRDNFGQWSGGVVSFGYLAPAVGSPVVAQNGTYEVTLPGKTHADIQNGADLRFSITYETEIDSLW